MNVPIDDGSLDSTFDEEDGDINPITDSEHSDATEGQEVLDVAVAEHDKLIGKEVHLSFANRKIFRARYASDEG